MISKYSKSIKSHVLTIDDFVDFESFWNATFSNCFSHRIQDQNWDIDLYEYILIPVPENVLEFHILNHSICLGKQINLKQIPSSSDLMRTIDSKASKIDQKSFWTFLTCNFFIIFPSVYNMKFQKIPGITMISSESASQLFMLNTLFGKTI